MKWQRARIIHPQFASPGSIGRLVWVQAEPPGKLLVGIGPDAKGPEGYAIGYHTNLTYQGRPLALRPDLVELLPEFAEDVASEELSKWEVAEQ